MPSILIEVRIKSTNNVSKFFSSHASCCSFRSSTSTYFGCFGRFLKKVSKNLPLARTQRRAHVHFENNKNELAICLDASRGALQRPAPEPVAPRDGSWGDGLGLGEFWDTIRDRENKRNQTNTLFELREAYSHPLLHTASLTYRPLRLFITRVLSSFCVGVRRANDIVKHPESDIYCCSYLNWHARTKGHSIIFPRLSFK